MALRIEVILEHGTSLDKNAFRNSEREETSLVILLFGREVLKSLFSRIFELVNSTFGFVKTVFKYVKSHDTFWAPSRLVLFLSFIEVQGINRQIQ